MKYKAVLFDMDGTVLDTLEDLFQAVNDSMAQFSLPLVERETVRAGLGNGAEHLIRFCLPGYPEETIRTVLDWYKPWYDAHCRIHTQPYAGILPMMEKLKKAGIRQAIISNKPDPAVRELAEHFFPGLLETAVGESAVVRRKPNPDAVLAAAARMDLRAADCVYVGDSEVDLRTAENAGMDCISVTWGFRSEEQLRQSGAKRLANSAEELSALILRA